MPTPRDIKTGYFYAVHWDRPSTYYWGKVLELIREEEESDVEKVEMKFLKRAFPSSNPSALRGD